MQRRTHARKALHQSLKCQLPPAWLLKTFHFVVAIVCLCELRAEIIALFRSGRSPVAISCYTVRQLLKHISLEKDVSKMVSIGWMDGCARRISDLEGSFLRLEELEILVPSYQGS